MNAEVNSDYEKCAIVYLYSTLQRVIFRTDENR